MADDDPNETDNEQRLRLWWGVRRIGLVQWVSICIVLAMVAGIFWFAIHFSKHGFLRSRFAVQEQAEDNVNQYACRHDGRQIERRDRITFRMFGDLPALPDQPS
jgi:hypothetical protein